MCCKNVPLERRAKISATINMVLAVLNLVSGSLELRRSILAANDASVEEHERDEALASRFLIIFVLFISAAKLVMGCVLWYGAAKRHVVYVRCWFVISLILWLIMLTNYIANLLAGTFLIFSTVTIGLALIVKVLVFNVVLRFLKELGSEEEQDVEAKKGNVLV